MLRFSDYKYEFCEAYEQALENGASEDQAERIGMEAVERWASDVVESAEMRYDLYREGK